jgi:bifunctional ADP-heptose synthase (sugar kinase/adenylyltransferase)
MPAAWRQAPIALLCPIAGELNLEWLDTFPNSLVGVTPQGWMRQWDERGLVSPKPWCEADQILPRVDVLVYSEEDVACDEDLIQHYAKLARIAVVTRGPRGATVYWDGRPRDFPAFRAAAELDPTGAGDVFAAAFLVRLKETDDPNVAAPFANSVASFAVEGPGTTTIPTRSQVEERLLRGQIITGRKPLAPGGDPTGSP